MNHLKHRGRCLKWTCNSMKVRLGTIKITGERSPRLTLRSPRLKCNCTNVGSWTTFITFIRRDIRNGSVTAWMWDLPGSQGCLELTFEEVRVCQQFHLQGVIFFFFLAMTLLVCNVFSRQQSCNNRSHHQLCLCLKLLFNMECRVLSRDSKGFFFFSLHLHSIFVSTAYTNLLSRAEGDATTSHLIPLYCQYHFPVGSPIFLGLNLYWQQPV